MLRYLKGRTVHFAPRDFFLKFFWCSGFFIEGLDQSTVYSFRQWDQIHSLNWHGYQLLGQGQQLESQLWGWVRQSKGDA